MLELFEFSFSYINIIPTILIVFVVLYWIVVLMGLVSMSSVELDVDADADLHVDVDMHADLHVDADIHADVDVDADMHVDADTHIGADVGHSGPGIMLQGLLFFNVGKAPFLILLSFFAIPLWFMSLTVNYYLHIESVAISILLLIPEIILSLFIAKFK